LVFFCFDPSSKQQKWHTKKHREDGSNRPSPDFGNRTATLAQCFVIPTYRGKRVLAVSLSHNDSHSSDRIAEVPCHLDSELIKEKSGNALSLEITSKEMRFFRSL